MGRVDNQLGQILDRLEDMKVTIREVAQEQKAHDSKLVVLEERVADLEHWREQRPDSSEYVRWSTLREKFTLPLTLSIIVFLATVVLPAVIRLIEK